MLPIKKKSKKITAGLDSNDVPKFKSGALEGLKTTEAKSGLDLKNSAIKGALEGLKTTPVKGAGITATATLKAAKKQPKKKDELVGEVELGPTEATTVSPVKKNEYHTRIKKRMK